MKILLIILLIIGGVVVCALLYPYIKKKNNLVKNSNLTTVAKLIQKFEQMTILDQGDTYYEYVSLVGKIKNKEFCITPFTRQNVVFYRAMANIITERTEIIKDTRGFDQTKLIHTEKTIFNEFKGDRLEFVDSSTPESVVLEINCGGCQIDTDRSFEKQISKEEFDSYNLNVTIPENLENSKVLGYKINEQFLENDSDVYVVGEARKSGGKIHICLSRDLKKPFIVSTKKKEEVIENYKDNSLYFLILGIFLIIVGIVLIFIWK